MRKLYIFLLIATVFAACSRVDEIYKYDDTSNISPALTRTAGGQDPYKLSVMQAALESVAAATSGVESIQLLPTDYYVRFQPADTTQMGILEDMDMPPLFSHPLDGSYCAESDDNILESIEPNGVNWAYTVVPKDFVFPTEIPYEIIYGVFIQHETSSSAEQQIPMNLYTQVLDKALEMTNNVPLSRAEYPNWRPSAKLSMQLGDSIMPIAGVKVIAVCYSKISEKYTDKNGETGNMSEFKYPVQYYVLWVNPKWEIRNGKTRTAFKILFFAGKYTNKKLEVTLSNTGMYGVISGIYRALQAYFHENHPLTEGLVKPNSMNVAILDEYDPDMSGEYYWGRRNPVHIYAKYKNGEYRTSESVASTTFHELGHSSHYHLQWEYFNLRYKKDKETWAVGVSYAYMKSLIPDYVGFNYNDLNVYTRLVESLMNQGVKLSDIQNSLRRTIDWDGWRLDLRRKGLIRSDFIDMLFAQPNRFVFNLKSPIIEAQESLVFGEKLVWFNLREAINPADIIEQNKWENITVSEWSLPDNNGRIVYNDNYRAGVVFSPDSPGIGTVEKRINAKVRYVAGVEDVCEKKIRAYRENIISISDNPSTYLPVQVGLLESRNDPWVWFDKCTVSPDGVVAPYDPEAVMETTIMFNKPGEKIIKINVNYMYINKNVHIEQQVEYERKINVTELADANSFVLNVNTKYPLRIGEWYTVDYLKKTSGKKIQVEEIDMRHITHYFEYYYDKTHWEIGSDNQSIKFQLPRWDNVPVNYMMRISYKVVGDTELKYADVLLSNLE